VGKDGIDALVEAQRGGCAICGVPYADVPGQRLAVDHDHRHCAGRIGCPVCIRGLLCNRCNNILRLAGDRQQVLLNAVAYLDLWERKVATS
jgi:hypothetical protein